MKRLAVLAACILAVPAIADEVPPHLAAARALLADVKPDATTYRHKDTVVRWAAPGVSAECHTDCSGLLNVLLTKDRPADLKEWFGKRRPLDEDYQATIADGKGFRRIDKVADIRAGDVVAIKYPPGGENTGHVMLADGPPRRRDATKPTVDGTTQYELTIIDSTSSPHGADDTRRADDGSTRTGLGRGTIRLYAADDGSLVGFAWSVGPGSAYRSAKERPLAVGRLSE